MSNTTIITEMEIYNRELANILADTYVNSHRDVFDLFWEAQSTFGDYNVAMNRTPMGTEGRFVAAASEDEDGDVIEFHFVLKEDEKVVKKRA